MLLLFFSHPQNPFGRIGHHICIFCKILRPRQSTRPEPLSLQNDFFAASVWVDYFGFLRNILSLLRNIAVLRRQFA